MRVVQQLVEAAVGAELLRLLLVVVSRCLLPLRRYCRRHRSGPKSLGYNHLPLAFGPTMFWEMRRKSDKNNSQLANRSYREITK